MPHVLDLDHADLAVRAVWGACNVEGGPTAEQKSVISALAHGYFRLSADPAHFEALGPEGAAEAFPSQAQRHRVGEVMVFLELCRHPFTATQVERVDAYAAALEIPEETLATIRDLATRGHHEARADYARYFRTQVDHLLDPQLAPRYGHDLDVPDPVLVQRLRNLKDCRAGTLGRAFGEFYERNGFALPGETPHMPAFFVAHDMSHVLAGYAPTEVGEIALGAMECALSDTSAHWVRFLGNLSVHEAGFLGEAAFRTEGVLARPGAEDAVAEAMDRGVRCSGDFTTADHLSMADDDLEDVRSRFGIPPLRTEIPA